MLVHNPISNNTALKLTNLTPKQLTKENYFCLTKIFLNSYAVMQQLIQKLLLAKTKKKNSSVKQYNTLSQGKQIC